MFRNERGVTLLEIVISVVIFSIGALSLVASSALMIRRLGEANRTSNAARVAARRLELTHSASCSAVGAGEDETFGIRSRWTPSTNAHALDIDERVQFTTRRGVHDEKFLSAVPCE